MTTEERLHERRDVRIAAGRLAFDRVLNGDHFRDWISVADALVAIREEAMERAHTNRPQGPPYRAAFKAIVEHREKWILKINDTTRTHCYWLVDNLPAVTAWRDGLGQNQRDEWNHPSTVKRNYERLTKAKEDKAKTGGARPQGSLEARHIELQEKHAALLAMRGGAFPIKLTPEVLAGLCADHRNADWLRRAGQALLAAAEASERQDRIEREVVAKRKAGKANGAPDPARC